MKEYNRQEQLKQVHRDRRSATDKKANDAIDYLKSNKLPVNFNKVSEVSGVSVTTLYKHENIRKRIESERAEIRKIPTPKERKLNMNDSGKDAIIASLKRKIEKLEEENKQLKKLNASRLSDEFDKLASFGKNLLESKFGRFRGTSEQN